jgi:RNA polymerase sigma factor (TIGR02999 family)
MTDLPALIARADGAERNASEQLFALLYAELRRLAEAQLRRRGGAFTLGATTLVHEAYMAMLGHAELSFPDRARFFAYASRAMRGLVIDYCRRRRAKKRGRELEITLDADDGGPAQPSDSTELVELADALDALASIDAKLVELVDLHFFGGVSFGEIAAMRAVSERTVQRDWQKARLLLHRLMRTSS